MLRHTAAPVRADAERAARVMPLSAHDITATFRRKMPYICDADAADFDARH